MKILTLLRHAKSSWADPGQSDFERPLSPRGRKAARAMGREMRRLGLGYDHILASPAARTMEALTELAQGYGGAVATDPEPRIYLAPPAVLLDLVHEADDAWERLLLVGHNPGMEQLALSLSRRNALRDRLAAKYPTGALAEIALPVAHWREVEESAGTLTRFVCPRDLDAALGPDQD
jgi:phosphohistidine phosphatase